MVVRKSNLKKPVAKAPAKKPAAKKANSAKLQKAFDASGANSLPIQTAGTQTAATAARGGKRYSGKLHKRLPELLAATIHVKVPGCNRRANGCQKLVGLYKDGLTVYEFLKAGGTMHDVRWDARRENIELRVNA